MKKYSVTECRSKYPKEKLIELLFDHTYKELELEFGYSERVFSQLAKEYNIPKNYNIINRKSSCKST